MLGFCVGFTIFAFLVSLGSLALSCWALMEVFAYKRSTHRVQFVSADEMKREMAEDKALNSEVAETYGRAMRLAFNEGDDER
jgi:hypothetical protein